MPPFGGAIANRFSQEFLKSHSSTSLLPPLHTILESPTKKDDLAKYLEWQEGVIDHLIPRLRDTGSLCWQVGNFVDTRRLTIEVKTSAQWLSGLLHLTRNEWNLATESLNHVFHLWDIRSVPPRLAVLDTETFATHIPIDQGSGEWKSAAIPFLAFEPHFAPSPIR